MDKYYCAVFVWLGVFIAGQAESQCQRSPSTGSIFVDATCSLSEAIDYANATPGPDTVELAESSVHVLTTRNNADWGYNGLPSITSGVTIEGHGARLERSGAAFRFFHVAPNGILTLKEIHLKGGLAAGGRGRDGGGGGAGLGGAIFNQGILRVEASTLSGSIAQGGNGGRGSGAGGGGGGVGGIGGLSSSSALGGGGGGGFGGTGGEGGSGFDCCGGGGGGGNQLGGRGGDASLFGGGAGGKFNGGAGGDNKARGGDGGTGGGGGGGGGDPLTSSSARGGDGGIGGGGGGGGGEAGNASDGGDGGFGGGGGAGGASAGLGGNSGGDGGSGGFGGGGGGGGTGGGAVGGAGGFGAGNGGFSGGHGGGGGGFGGAIFNHGGTVTVSNSTLSGNLASGGAGGAGSEPGNGLGGAIFNRNGQLTINNVTFSGNFADTGGGIYSLEDGGTATLALHNSIVANSINRFGQGVTDCVQDGRLTSVEGAYNLIEANSTCPGNRNDSDPRLSALSVHGGATPTYALGPDSPAVDAGSPAVAGSGGDACEAVDQRGVSRPRGAVCDIGAFELQGARWAPTGSMNSARFGATATLLLSGKVLVAGGKTTDSETAPRLDRAELFDPTTGTWRQTGALGDARAGHTATLLPNGRVLVVGGTATDNSPLATAELYDPATGTWTLVGLPAPRSGHTATLLHSGKVLLAGGRDGSDAAAESYLYNPAAGAGGGFEPAGELRTGRYDHTATLLPSGEVLVVGGLSNGTALQTAELYGSGSAGPQWTDLCDLPGASLSTCKLSNARANHGATSLGTSGQVLVTGGRNPALASVDISSVEIFDPSCNCWSPASPTQLPRSGHKAALLPSDEVLVIGGARLNGGRYLAELFDSPGSRTWTTLPVLSEPRRAGTAILLPSGEVLALGDSDGSTTSDVFNPAVDGIQRMETTPLPDARVGHTATLLPSGDVLVAGGSGASGANGARYHPGADPDSAVWSPAGALANARRNHTATLLASGRVLIVGGEGSSGALKSAEIYTPDSGWSPAADLTLARRDHTATLLASGKVLVVGGRGETEPALAGAEISDPDCESSPVCPWSTAGTLTVGRFGHTATQLPSGEVLVAGGLASGGSALRSAELYDPGACPDRTSVGSTCNPWRTIRDMSDSRAGHAAVLLPSGEVLVAGGEVDDASRTTAEIYDPATGNWKLAGELRRPRADFTLTLLPSGMVVALGGHNGDTEHATAELFDPATAGWTLLEAGLAGARRSHTATLLRSGGVLVGGGEANGAPLDLAEILQPSYRADRRPDISSASATIEYGEPVTIEGVRFGGGSEASHGSTDNSAVNYPLVQLRAVEGDVWSWIVPDPRNDFSDFSAAGQALTFSDLPPVFNPGWYHLTVFTAGIPSESQLVRFACGLVIDQPPRDQVAPLGSSATFGVETQGGRSFQWQQCVDDEAACRAQSFCEESAESCFRDSDCPGGEICKTPWKDIPNATAPSYDTPPIKAADSGTRFRVSAASGCTTAVSAPAVLNVEDHARPGCKDPDPFPPADPAEPCPGEPADPPVAVVDPNGGELWTLSTADEPSVETISWTMSDNVRICRVELDLLYSTDGGKTFNTSGLDLPDFDLGESCIHPGLETTSATFEMPTGLPAGEQGALFKVSLEVTDHAGNAKIDESDRPFFIVEPNNQSIKTLILWHPVRMAALDHLDTEDVVDLGDALVSFAAHPEVRGRIVDLDFFHDDLAPLYDAWDHAAETDVIETANDVLFGAGGIHEQLGLLLADFTGVEYLVLIGDDRAIPLERIEDETATAPEECYHDPKGCNPDSPGDGDLTPDGTTVGRALAAGYYLSDDRLASSAGRNKDLEEGPDLAVGRLVESPADIVASIATFISQEGILDLTAKEENDPKVLVTAYDFLVDSGTRIRDRWSALAPDELIDPPWTSDTLLDRLCFQSKPYGVLSLNGHATHYLEGVPGSGAFDIQGLPTTEIVNDGFRCNLTGSVVYAVGCHSGLPVAGSRNPDEDHHQDLPETMLRAGAMVYLANTGYGWGLKHGVGYSERLVEIFTEELLAGDTVTIGNAVKRAKQLYSLNASRFDVYDEKVSKQWTLYGFPMYSLKTRNPESAKAGASGGLFAGPPPRPEDLAWRERFGPVTVERRVLGKTFDNALVAPPPFLTRLNLAFDFSAEGVYKKVNAAGIELAPEAPCDTPEGCYYTLNNVSSGQDLATAATDRPLQPMFVYDSRLSGTAFHGFLWKGGTYVEEREWIPLVAELQSNVPGEPFDAGSLPSPAKSNGLGRVQSDSAGSLDGTCPASDLDVSSLVLEAGEVLRETDDSPAPDVQRRYETVDVEILYFNDAGDPGANCDVSGPTVLGVVHRAVGTTVDWEVEASDPAGVWRVVVVWNDGTIDASGRGRWSPVELAADAAGVFRGSAQAQGSRLTYFVQAVDRKGNVTVPVGSAAVPPSGVPLGLPELITVDLAQGDADLAVALTAAPNPVPGLETLVATIDVTNRGPDPAAAVAVTVALPAGLADVSATGRGWSCEVEATVLCRRNVAELGQAPPITLIATAPPIGGDVVLTAAVRTSSRDAVAANDSASATVTVLPAPQVDLEVVQTVSFAADGRSPIFTVTVRNPGFLAADGARVFDSFPAALTRVAWTCVARLGSFCSRSGVGPIDDLVTVGGRSRVDYVVSTALASGFGGLLRNTATVAPPAGFYDPRPETNSATVTIDYGSIFTDGFESGDVTRWSAAVGGTP